MRSFRIHHTLVLAVFLLMPLGSSAFAGDRTEVEHYDLPNNGGFQNPFFSHALRQHEFEGNDPPVELFSNTDSISGAFSYALAPGTDLIRFNLAEGEFVDFAQVWMRTSFADGPAAFHVIGFDVNDVPLDLVIETPVGPSQWIQVDSSGEPFARITEIRLSGIAKGFFDDLTVNVVPEPATWVLVGLGAGGLVLLRRRRPVSR